MGYKKPKNINIPHHPNKYVVDIEPKIFGFGYAMAIMYARFMTQLCPSIKMNRLQDLMVLTAFLDRINRAAEGLKEIGGDPAETPLDAFRRHRETSPPDRLVKNVAGFYLEPELERFYRLYPRAIPVDPFNTLDDLTCVVLEKSTMVYHVVRGMPEAEELLNNDTSPGANFSLKVS